MIGFWRKIFAIRFWKILRKFLVMEKGWFILDKCYIEYLNFKVS